MTIRQIRYFTTVAQLEHVSRAAEFLHISQSSLSKSIANLEGELGAALFVRDGKRLTLNAAGARFLEFAGRMLRELEDTRNDIRLIADGSGAKLKIGLAGSSRRFMDCVAAFLQQNPGTELDLCREVERQEHPDINEFDVLIYPEEPRYEKFVGYALDEERYQLAVPAGHPLSGQASASPRALDGQNVVFLRGGRSYVEYPSRICGALVVRFASQCFADVRETHRRLIASGACIGFVPDGEAAFYRDAAIRLIPISEHQFSRRIRICFRREKHLSPLARRFRDFAADYLELEA